jgi:hypothetical protein
MARAFPHSEADLRAAVAASASYAEVLRRLDEVRSGTAEMIPGEEVMAELEAFLGETVPLPSKGSR